MKKIITTSFLLAVAFVLFACGSNKSQDGANSQLRKAIVEELKNLKGQLPQKMGNTPAVLEDVKVEGDIVVYVVFMSDELLRESFSFGSEVANSDKNMAQLINNIGKNHVKTFLDAGLGIKYIYKSSETGDTYMTIEADCDRLQRVIDGIASGEIVAYSVLDKFQMEIDGYDFPVQLEEGFWLVDGYIRNRTVYYISKQESEMTTDDFSDAGLLEMKNGVVAALKETLLAGGKKEMAEKDIRIVYIYKNKYDDEFARVEITADDL